MKNLKNNSLTLTQKAGDRFSKTLAAALIMFPWLLPMTASADIGDAAKNAGTSVSKILFIVLIVVGGVCLLAAFIMMATGSERLNQKGHSWLFKALVGIGGGALTSLLLAWIWNAATSAGGGNFLNWPF
ncbi:hypothetical protein [Leuconostoc pseudomesenteroides]|uniref:hypothetical protein n=1 Tax=Leuconostoc pseudomesenteroides TaxID=33968 RepID=UPI004034FC9B